MKQTGASIPKVSSGAGGRVAGVFGRLKLWQKFALIGALVVPTVVFPYVQYVSHVRDLIEQSAAEASGLPAINTIADLVEDIQVHRGLTAALLGGNESVSKPRADREKEVARNLAKLEEFVRVTAPLAEGKTSKEMTEVWTKIKSGFPQITQRLATRSLSVTESFRLHTALVEELFSLNDSFMDHHKLHLDPNAHTYHLIQATFVQLPELSEDLGQLRALGTNALASLHKGDGEKGKGRADGGGLSDAVRGRLAALVADANKSHETVDRSINKAYQAKPELEKSALAKAEQAADTITKETVAMIERELLNTPRPNYSSEKYFKELTDAIESNVAFHKAASETLKQELDSSVATSRRELLIESSLMLLLAVIATLVGVLSARSVLRPVAQLQGTMQKLREGDTTARARLTSTDEIGQLASEFDTMVDQREAVSAKIFRDNEILNDSIIDILRSVAKTAQGDLTVQAPVREDVTGALSDAINSMADSTAKTLAKVTAAANEVRSASQDGRDTVQQTSRGMNDIRGTIQETAKRIKRLGERSQEITGIVKLIDDIAERTSVLALNANMQAAMAGEAGRGFRVVADEVQRLAERSKEATDQIGKLVGTIQAETNDTMSTMDRAIGEVVKGGELADKAAEKVTQLDELGGELLQSVGAFKLPEEVLKQARAEESASRGARRAA